MKVTRKYTREQLFALAGSAIYTSCNLTDGSSDDDVRLVLNAKAHELVVASGLSPTELKDLGLEILKGIVR